MKRIRLLLTCLIVFGTVFTGYSQNWDYEKYPKLDVDLQHLNADIRIDEFGAIQGDISYRAQVNVDDPDSLVFDASRINILQVSVNDAEKEFSMRDDQLVIYLDDVFARESVLNVRVQYEASPRFGVLRDVNRTTWTSQLPKSTRHWLPVIDHPRVQFTSEFVFTHPSGNTMISNGRRVRSGVVSVDEERTGFATDNPVPATALAWAFGEFTEIATGSVNRLQRDGNQPPIQIHLYSESGLDTDLNLAEITSTTLQTVRNRLRVPYPYRDLKIVILDNDFWETKSYAAGLIFVYRNHGSIEQQIRRGVISQWIGTHIREEQWSDADAVHVIHAFLANQIFEPGYSSEKGFEPYDIFSPYGFSRWEYFLKLNELHLFNASLQSALSNILDDTHNILGWRELSDIIYNRSGQPFFEGFEPGEINVEEGEPAEYIVRVDWNESGNTVQLNFEAVGESIDELVTVSVEETTFQDARQHEVTFTGQSESIVLNVSSGIENLKISTGNREDLELRVEKPFQFWIYQLRNDTEDEKRAEAARALADFTDNPDLQLALNDILRVESSPHVYAEIIRSLSKLTTGASGMDERFLDYSSSQQHLEVRKAAVEALAYFRNNERVISRLQSVVLETQYPDLQKEAIHSLSEVTEAQRFNSIADNLVAREPVLDHVPLILRLLGEKGREESAVEMAGTFIASQFPYKVRNEVLVIMLEYDRSPSNWQERLPDLFDDTHPGIRYRAASALEFLSTNARNTLLDRVLEDEYDERVRRALASYQ